MSASAVLSIGTTDPWNIAGVGRDALIAAELNQRIFTVVAAVSAQGTHGVEALQPLSPYILDAQLGVIPWERVAAIRIGALATAGNVRAVATHVRMHAPILAVVDPVFSASCGGALADEAGIVAMRDDLAVAPNVVLTPNLAEAARLLGRERIERDAMAEAARALHARGAYAVLLKGGHLAGDPCDVLASDAGVQLFAGPRLPGEMRGTGCTLAIALACSLARGLELGAAVESARDVVRAKIAQRASRTSSE